MADLGECWPKEPDWSAAPHAWGLEIRPVDGVFQTLVSGDLEAWSAESRIGLDVAPALVPPESSEPITLMVWVGDGRMDSRLAIEIPTDGPLFKQVDAVTLKKPVRSAS